jgi:predicted nucleic acid-binding protein
MFALSYQFLIPDILYEEELSEKHSKLLQFGLVKKSMSGKQMLEAYKLKQEYRKLSLNDCLAYLLAKNENSLLLTGDGELRKLAERLNIAVHGTIWLVEQMIDQKKISIEKARLAVQRMKDSGSYLPWGKAEKMLQRKEKEAKNNH